MENKQKTIYKSLAAFQQEVPTIHKNTKGYGYSYANLSQIFEVINPLLKNHGLGFTQLINEGKIKTVVFQIETGETLESSIDIPEGAQLKGQNEFQTLGSAITYLRRYSISSMLGLVTDADTDAGGEQVKKAKPKKQPLTTERFAKALDALANDKIKKEDITKYDLTAEQTKQLDEFINLQNMSNE